MNDARPAAGDLSHPLIAAYLDNLARELDGAEDRDEVVQSVREHIAEALSRAPESTDSASASVRAVLDELGPIERITAMQDRSPSFMEPGPPWILIGVGILAVASFALVFVVPFVAIPLAVATLAIGVMAVARHRHRHRDRKRAGWAIVVISTLTLIAALIGALIFVRWGPSAPTDGPTRSPVPAESPLALPTSQTIS